MPFILETGCLPRLAQLMMHKNVGISVPALRSIGNIVTRDDLQAQMVTESGILLNLNELIYSAKKSIRKEVLWIISNITADSSELVQKCLDIGLI